ncbi:phenylacetate--CoA ligase family protein [Paenibacillus sp. 1001270B_150601_E10]|uniref:phenylacetate--CoA ligase family protein n=1 Tax=Paenibacillus sp. 1001270B_150601_E10 TaxID=2787079 RepID=UPI00189DFA08|nr:phenylacetate--CoA ligase family protein [Paenibacillus sp. 1001270B_150601_E10]
MIQEAVYEGIYRLGSAIKGWNVWEILNRQREMQWQSADDMNRYKEDKLHRLLKHAERHNPYYRRLFLAQGITWDQFSWETFKRIPLLTKHELHDYSEQLCSEGSYLNARWNSSGGSTGQMARLLQDENFRNHSRANKLLFDEWTNTRLGQRKLTLWGAQRDIKKSKIALLNKLGSMVHRRMTLSSYQMNHDIMVDYVNEINRYKPEFILAYAHSIYELALLLEKGGCRLIHRPRAIMTSAGTLFPEMRAKIEEQFGAPVFNRYGSREVGDIACECSHHQGLHISGTTHMVEIIREDGSHAEPGEVGEIVVTLLTNKAMPLIRYQIGDRGALAKEPCACGRGWPLIQQIQGRSQDYLYLEDGSKVDGACFMLEIIPCKWIRRFQIIQEERGVADLYCIPENMDSAQVALECEQLKQRLDSLVEQQMRINVHLVDEIQETITGKHRYIINRVSAP